MRITKNLKRILYIFISGNYSSFISNSNNNISAMNSIVANICYLISKKELEPIIVRGSIKSIPGLDNYMTCFNLQKFVRIKYVKCV